MSSSLSDIAAIRKDYQKAVLDETGVGTEPVEFFLKWFEEAKVAKIDEVNAMTLATCDVANKPHARIVLLKSVEKSGFVFYSNYESNKGKEINENHNAALVFFWKELERQVRIEGKIEKISGEESELYFYSRPEGSKLGAWASPQSKVISDRKIIEENYINIKERFQNLDIIPRPAHWGGYRVIPDLIEFWQGRTNRMHDRILFSLAEGNWLISRLAP